MTAACPPTFANEVHLHLDSEFADAALWYREAPGCRDGLAALAATGVRLGIVSNADGLIGERLRDREILQVGPGIGVEVDCVIDSGAVGVMKPDPRIFTLALDAMGVEAGDSWYVGDMPGDRRRRRPTRRAPTVPHGSARPARARPTTSASSRSTDLADRVLGA